MACLGHYYTIQVQLNMFHDRWRVYIQFYSQNFFHLFNFFFTLMRQAFFVFTYSFFKKKKGGGKPDAVVMTPVAWQIRRPASCGLEDS